MGGAPTPDSSTRGSNNSKNYHRNNSSNSHSNNSNSNYRRGRNSSSSNNSNNNTNTNSNSNSNSNANSNSNNATDGPYSGDPILASIARLSVSSASPLESPLNSTDTTTSAATAATVTATNAITSTTNSSNTNNPATTLVSPCGLISSQITVTVYVPTQSVGAVIGKGGATIASLQQKAQAAGNHDGNLPPQVRVSVAGQPPSNNNEGTDSTNATTSSDIKANTSPASATTTAETVAAETTTATTTTTTATAATASNTSTATVNPYLNQHHHHHQAYNSSTSNVGNGISNTPNNNSYHHHHHHYHNTFDHTELIHSTYSPLDFSSPHWTPIILRGEPASALYVTKHIEQLVEVDEIVVDIPLSQTKHAAVIGKRGLTLAHLSADTNARIMVPQRHIHHDIIQLEGDISNVISCMDRIFQMTTHSNNAENMAATSTNSGKDGSKAATSATSSTDPKKQNNANALSMNSNNNGTISAVILLPVLPSTNKLRTISKKTETTMRKKKREDGTGWNFTITGTTNAAVQTAVQLLHKWADDKAEAGAKNAATTNTTTNSKSTAGGSESPRRGKNGGRNKASR